MHDIASGSEVEPVVAAHDEWFDIQAGKNCMGMRTFEYSFGVPNDPDFLETFSCLGTVTFPIGRNNGMFKIDVPGLLMIEGILGLRRLRITLRLDVDPVRVRAHFEGVLAMACANVAERDI